MGIREGERAWVWRPRLPRRVKRKDPKEKQAKDKRLKCFVKMTNYNHLMPTRYTLEVDLKSVVTPDVLDNATKKTDAQKSAKKVLEEKFESGKHRWFFTKLPF